MTVDGMSGTSPAVPPLSLSTERLTLVEVGVADAGSLARGDSERPAVTGYPLAGTRVAAAAVVASGEADTARPGFGMYQMVRRRDGLVVGDLGFHAAPVEGSVEIGYGLAVSARGAGLCTEAVIALCRWALAQDGVDRVVAHADTAESVAVLLRAGFTPTGDGSRPGRFESRRA